MYDHYIGLDWAQNIMAIARLSKSGKKSEVFEYPSNVTFLKEYLKKLHGKKLLTLEESTAAQWLYVELQDYVDELIVCDPRRNRLLSEGAKTDKNDALKLAQLAKADMLREVYHSGEIYIDLRKIVSGYQDVIKAGTRWKNQRSAFYRGLGKSCYEELEGQAEAFVLQGIEDAIEAYENERARYQQYFKDLCKRHDLLKNLRTVPGIDIVGAVKIAARVVNARRFKNVKKFWAYCGLVSYEKLSGGKSYGKRRTNYFRMMKDVLGTAALNCLKVQKETCVTRYYRFLTNEKRLPDHVAKNAIKRHIASVILGVMKHGKKFNGERTQQIRLSS